jgi:hypothetical protein
MKFACLSPPGGSTVHLRGAGEKPVNGLLMAEADATLVTVMVNFSQLADLRC